ncbi:MAG: SDR family NAD(P)-dependent oxidoreductase [Polyangiaceae bacterium]|jgi:(3R)-3-hydroxyacyl-CoA dehydrogenase / 3a,7a,12a-trihydroxy-5b-cholest-24-enoyl-CoA hydratase / enoyl-CoA hydratase 2
MGNELRFDGRVAIVTGAGAGLGRSHALLLASRGAKVVVNDLGGSRHGDGKSSAAADAVVDEIKKAGGEAVANYDSVEDGAKIVQTALDTWKRIDIVVNNAGILRDTSFQKMTAEDWDLIYRVHVLGGFRVSHAAWNHMRDAGYGRIVFTSSAAGIYGNFGQANYAMAKLGLVGLASTLAIEGKKKNVFVNAIAPLAGSRLTETVLPKELLDALKPEYVSPLVAWLCHDSCEENGGLFEVGGGFVGKLRWERAAGAIFKLGKPIAPEAIQREWSKIAGFEKTTHPGDITQSMQPILDNLNSKSKGGNEFIDVDLALASQIPNVTSSYDERDVALYALGVGAAQNPLDPKDLPLVYELAGDGFRVLPTFGVIPALNVYMKMAKEGKQTPGLNYGFDRVLHGEQYTEIKRPLPSHATLTHKTKIKDIFDKGKNALVVTATTSVDENGEELIYNELTTFVRGAGGWGGERGPSADVNVPPDRAPDAVISEKTTENQALLYRLSGDWNPLHADPTFAANFGFKKPILHGLCTFGFAARHVIKAFCDGDPRRFKSIKVRFAESVFPGETIKTEMWKESDGKIIFRCKVAERDATVISNAAIELYASVPTAKPKPVAAAPSASAHQTAAPGALSSHAVMFAINHHLEAHPELVSQIGTVFQWKLSSPDSAWVLDVKNGKGSCKQGTAEKPDVTLELSDADFISMSTGQADAQKLYFGGKLKISGNVMASQKLEFLKKIDRAAAAEAFAKKMGGADVVPGAQDKPHAHAAGAATAAGTDAIMFAIGHHLETHPELVAKVGTVFQWKLTNPDSAWTLDVKNGKGSCAKGTAEKPDVTLELSDGDFVAMATGKADAQKLYFGGKLKISGNVMASQKLEFLKQVDAAAAAKAYAAKHGGGAASPAAAASPGSSSAPKQPRSPAILAALKDRLAKTPADIAGVIQFEVKNPDKSFFVDAKSVSEGSAKGATTTVRMEEDDLVALVKGQAAAHDLFMHGKLRVDGDVRVAHNLGFLQNLL